MFLTQVSSGFLTVTRAHHNISPLGFKSAPIYHLGRSYNCQDNLNQTTISALLFLSNHRQLIILSGDTDTCHVNFFFNGFEYLKLLAIYLLLDSFCEKKNISIRDLQNSHNSGGGLNVTKYIIHSFIPNVWMKDTSLVIYSI